MKAAVSFDELERPYYLLEMSEMEAVELSEYLGDRMRLKKSDGTPQIEVQVRNALHGVGLKSRTLAEKYGIRRES